MPWACESINYPFYLDVNDVPGIEVIRTDGALIAHIKCVDEHIDRLQYPCRCEAMIAILCMRGKVSFSAHLADYELTPGMAFISYSPILEFRHSEDCELYAVILKPSFVDDMLPDKRLLIPASLSRRMPPLRPSTVYMVRMMATVCMSCRCATLYVPCSIVCAVGCRMSICRVAM